MDLKCSRRLSSDRRNITGPRFNTLWSKVKMELDYEKQKIKIRGIGLNYIKIGNGEHPVLLLPGALGEIWLDFKPQIESLDKEKFTIIAWDPPGYGQSRPPIRTFPIDFFQQDATYAYDLMKALGYDTFSMMGWCNGGITSIVLASMYPDSVRKIIIISTGSFITLEELKVFIGLRDLDSWTEKMLKPLITIYGEDYVRSVWPSWVDAMIDIYENRNGNLCLNILDKVQSPTLIVHGEGDRIVNESHAKILANKIPDSRVRIFEKGYHDPHLRCHKEFNELATKFLLSSL